MESRRVGHIAARLKRNRGKGALLIGAGCSRSAGIPLAQGFEEIIRTQFPADWEATTEPKTYTKLMERLGEAQCRNLILEHVVGRKINLAHLAIATLIASKKVDRVVTTNFDPLLTQACGLLGTQVAVYDVDAQLSERFRMLDIGLPAILYVHGQYSSFTQHISETDYTARHSARLKELFKTLSETHTWIVVGYSGENDPSAAPLFGQTRFPHELYWVGYNDNPPSEIVLRELLDPPKNAFFVSGYDADSFFGQLASEVGCNPMRLFGNPFSHLQKLLQEVEFPSGTEADNKRKNSLFMVHQAVQQYEIAAAGPSAWRAEERLLVPDAHRGLIFTLPTFRQLKPDGYQTPGDFAREAGSADFRLRAFQTNWGPPVVAIEHHLGNLEHCWIGCTPQVPQEHYELMRRAINIIAPAVECHVLRLTNPNSILDVQEAVKQLFVRDGRTAGLSPEDIIADITGGLSTITAGIVLATLDEDRAIEYLTQGVSLVQEGRALTPEEIRERQLLVGIRTSGDMVRDIVLRAAS